MPTGTGSQSSEVGTGRWSWLVTGIAHQVWRQLLRQAILLSKERPHAPQAGQPLDALHSLALRQPLQRAPQLLPRRRRLLPLLRVMNKGRYGSSLNFLLQMFRAHSAASFGKGHCILVMHTLTGTTSAPTLLGE